MKNFGNAQQKDQLLQEKLPPQQQIIQKQVTLHRVLQNFVLDYEGILGSAELIKLSHKAAIAKTKLTVIKTIMLGLLAGFYISMSAHCSLRVALGLNSKVYDIDGNLLEVRKASQGAKVFVIGAIFPLGLIIIVINGAELFTGNTMAFIPAFLHGDVKMKQILRNWILVYFSNFSACLFYGCLFVKLPGFFDGDIKEGIAAIAEGKINCGFAVNFLKGVGCNWLVNMAIMMGMTAQGIGSKLIALWWPILAFICMGFEHSIANMFFIPSGMMHGANVSVQQFIFQNLIPVTLGNIIGGSIMVGVVYTIIYHQPKQFFKTKIE